ncbi:MAG: hypothetical protein PVH84_07330 [Candidatus Aminicenantes bacterium]|jgi:hypothetical protein
MDKDTALHELFMTMKISLKNAAMYNQEHPAFVKAVTDVKERIDNLFEYMSPIEISFSPHALMVGDRFWDEEKLYKELGRTFHFRKVKKFMVSRGVTLPELMVFMSHISLTPRDIFKKGGIEAILQDQKISHITVEELDYSQLLEGEGEEVKDVWAYLLQEAVEQEDKAKLMEVAGSFEKVIKDFEPEEFLEDKEFSENFIRFFDYLKVNEEENYRKCAKNLVRTVVKKKEDMKDEEKTKSIKAIITDLKEEDLANSLWDELISDDDFDSLSFSIFSKLIERDKHEKVATSLSEIFKQDDTLREDPHAERKIKELLSGTSSTMMSEIYRHTLNSFLKDISYETKLAFDHTLLQKNYRYILLDLLKRDTLKEDIAETMARIFEEWDTIKEEKDLEYIRYIYETFQEKDEESLSDPQMKQYISKMVGYVEHSMLEGDQSLEFDYFIENLKESTLDVNTYLERIFTEGKISSYILKAFFKFFKEYLFYFNLNIDQKSSDRKFLEKMIKSLQEIDTPLSLITLKNIYSTASATTKYRVLRAMHKLTETDEKFLFPILKSKEPALKAEALILLMRDQRTKGLALDMLFRLHSPYGIRNKRLLEHIKIVEDKDLREAKLYLKELSQRRGFWNRKLKKRALNVLERWNAE